MVVCIGIAFIIGNSLSTFLNAVMSAIGGALAAVDLAKTPPWPNVPETAPWRDPKWRRLATAHFRGHAPADTLPMNDALFKLELERLPFLPEEQRGQALLDLNQRRIKLAADDLDWKNWYQQLDRLINAGAPRSFEVYLAEGMRINLEVTALYLLLATFFVPAIRHWFVFCFCFLWLLLLFAEVYTAMRRTNDPWRTWSSQMDFLTDNVLSGRVAHP